MRPRVVVAPAAGRVEIALPDSEPAIARRGFLFPVTANGDGKSFFDNSTAQVSARHTALSEEAAVLIGIFWTTIGRSAAEQGSQPVPRNPAAGPGAAGLVRAGLRQFGSIKPQQAHALLSQPEAIAVTDPPFPGNWRWRRIKRGRNHGETRQDHDSENGPARAGKGSVREAPSCQDFTTR